MPPESLPWDRFKERRYDRPLPEGPGSRWRDPTPHNGFRGRPPCNGSQGLWRYHSADCGRGFAPSRVNDKFIGEEGFRPSGYRMDGRYNRFNRDKGPFGHRDMRGNSWEIGMSPNGYGRPHLCSDTRLIDERGSFGQKDLKGHCWENGRLQNGSDQRSLDEKASFGRRYLRRKYRENGIFPDSAGRLPNGNDQCSVDQKAPFEKKDLKRRSPETDFLPNGFGRPHTSNDQMSQSFAQNDLKGKSGENSVLPNISISIHTGSDQSLLDDKDIKGHNVENGLAPSSGNNRSPVDDVLTFTSPTHSDLARTQDEHFKDQCDKFTGANDLTPGRKFRKENSLGSIDWQPLKWTRSGSFSSRAPKTEMSPVNAAPLRSPSSDAAARPTVSAVSSDEAGSRKKPRLGWGEGLAKFEKKKVEGPHDDSATKPGLIVCISGEPSHVANVADKSPRVACFLECASPATPSSNTCSSSQDVEDKACARSANLDYDISYSSVSPSLQLQEHMEGNRERGFCLENVEQTSVANLKSSPEDRAVVESTFERLTPMNKLLAWRGETLKALEVTESEIDSLENDLEGLISESGSNHTRPETFSSLRRDPQAEPCEDVLPNTISLPAPLQVISSGDADKNSGVMGEDRGQVRNEDLVTPTCKHLEPLSRVKGDSCSVSVKNDERRDNILEDLEECPVYGSTSNDKNIEVLSCSKSGDHSIASDNREALCDQILVSNKDTAINACEVFNKLLPSNHCNIRALRTRIFSCWKDDPQIMEKFMFKRRCRRFQERVNTLKYRALQHLWKEDLQLMLLKKNRSKSQKRLEFSSRGLHCRNQKHHFSFRSRFSTTAENLSIVPAAGVINSACKLLSGSQIKPCRNSLKMPALITDKEKVASRFISDNGLVEDPCAVEKERIMINPWTKEEKEIFMDKLTTHGKDFSTISSYLDHKTTADCVEFYYKNHKSDCFVKPEKKPDFSKQGKSYSFNNYLIGSGKRWSPETNAASLDVLGEASAIVAKADNAMKTRQENSGSKPPKIDRSAERLRHLNFSVNERETEAANVLADICCSISSKATSSCISGSFDRGEINKNLTDQRVSSDDDSCSDDSRGEIEHADWTDEEKSIFLQAFASCGNDFTMISRRVGTKSGQQCTVFFSKLRKCFGLDTIGPRLCVEGEYDDSDGGNDNGGACVVESDEIVSSEKSSSRADLLSDVGMNVLGKNDCKDPNESKNMVIEELPEESKPAMDLEGQMKMENGVDNEPAIVLNPMSTVLHPNIEEDRGQILSTVESVLADKTKNHGFSALSTKVVTVQRELCYGKSRAEDQGISSESNPNDKHENTLNDKLEDDNTSNDKQEATGNGLRDLNCIDQDFHASDNPLNVAAGSSDARVDFEGDINQDQKINLELDPPQGSHDISHGGNSCPVTVTPPVLESIPTRARVGFEGIREKLYKKSTSLDAGTKYQSSSSVFVGYPLHLAVNRDMNRECQSDMSPSQQGLIRRRDGSDTPNLVVDFPFQSIEPKNSPSSHHSWSSSDSEKPRSNGDVRLFGQILKSKPRPNGSFNSTPGDINQKLSGTDNVDLNSVAAKLDLSSYIGNENAPTRSFGFWDGNRVPIGFSSLSDSATLLAKYPATFGNLSSSSSIEQHQVLQSVVKSNTNHNLIDVSNFPSREMTSGKGVVDYQLYRNQQELISEMQMRNGIRAFSNLRNPIGVVGTNVGISDPVAAIKMHYAKVDQ